MACSKALAIVFISLLVFSAASTASAEGDSCYCKCLSQCTTVVDIFDCSKACESGCIAGGHEGIDKDCHPGN